MSTPVTELITGSSSLSSRGNVHQLPVPHPRFLIADRSDSWRDAVTRRLDHLCKLPVGWDGYRAGPVRFSTAFFALNMLNVICGPDAPTPSIVPGLSGDLQIEWHLKTGDIELHVRAPNDVHAWRETPETGEDGQELPLTNDFTEIVRWMKDLTESMGALIRTAA